MKYKNNGLLLLLCIITTMTSGCELEYPMDGEICTDQDHPSLTKVLIDKNVWCTRENCPSSENCCLDLNMDNDLRKKVAQAFEYNMCPKDSDIATCINGTQFYYCSKGCPSDLSSLHMISCENGVGECEEGFGDCDGNISNGCETNLSSLNMESCDGGIPECTNQFADCDNDIKNGCEYDLNANHVVSCKEGKIVECAEGFSDCDTMLRGGCEYDLKFNHVTSCEKSVILSCDDGYSDCDNKVSNGCEYHLEEKNALSCQNQSVECTQGYMDCDKWYTNGCEVDINNTDEHCGACNQRCDILKERCEEGHCVKKPCNPGFELCGSGDNTQCISKKAGHLNKCDKNQNLMICEDLYADCNDEILDGCETLIGGNDPENCGECGTICSVDQKSNSLATACNAGSCEAIACKAGYQLTKGSCVACANGEYGANGVCTKCPAGTISNADHTACSPCEAGTYAYMGSTTCTTCGTNQISTPGAASCVACDGGTHANNTHTTCLGCTSDNQCKIMNGTNRMSCVSGVCKAISCTAGYRLYNDLCFACPSGTYSTGGTETSCTACPEGSISSIGQSTCTSCNDGFYTTDHKTCDVCSAGTSTSETNHTSCKTCPEDTYSMPGTGCISCPDNMHSNTGASSCVACLTNDHCPLPIGAASMQCVSNECQVDQCFSHYILNNDTCYAVNANLLSRSSNPSAECIAPSKLCVENYINWTNQICIPRGLPDFNFDHGENVDNNSTYPIQIYYNDNPQITGRNSTRVKQIQVGNTQNAINALFNSDAICKKDENYTNSVNIQSSTSCSSNVYTICIKTIDTKTHTQPYYYVALVYHSYSYNHSLLLWRKIED